MLLCLLLCSGGLAAQFSLSTDYYRPAGRFGRIFQHGFGITAESFEDGTPSHRTFSYFVRLYRITAHQDTLQSTYSVDSGGGTFRPGYEVYGPAYYGELGLQGSYRLPVGLPFTPLLTASGQGFISRYRRQSFGASVVEDVRGGERGAGVSLGAGAEHEVNREFTARLLLNHTFQFGSDYGYTRYWRISLAGVYFW